MQIFCCTYKCIFERLNSKFNWPPTELSDELRTERLTAVRRIGERPGMKTYPSLAGDNDVIV